MRILGSRGSGRFGLDSMTPKRGNAMAEHRGDGRRVQTLIVTAAVVLVTAAAAAQGDAPEAPATVKEVMVTMTIPSSRDDAAYEPPNDDEQWVAVRKNAVMLVESGKLLMTSERARDNTTWMEMARELVVQAEATLKAAEARNADALLNVSDPLYLSCETCHERYLLP